MLDVSCAVKNEAFGAPTHTRHSENLSPKTRNVSYAASESKAKKKRLGSPPARVLSSGALQR